MAQYIYGKNMVMQRLSSGKAVGKLFLLEGMKDQNLMQAAKKAKSYLFSNIIINANNAL